MIWPTTCTSSVVGILVGVGGEADLRAKHGRGTGQGSAGAFNQLQMQIAEESSPQPVDRPVLHIKYVPRTRSHCVCIIMHEI